MPRTLPWLTSQPTAAATKPSHRPAKRPRLSTPLGSGSDSDDHLNTTGVSTPTRKALLKRPAARTPSTSPPAAPPPQERMREGYAADDGWLMVEDEFLSTAQLFTQHLHHAEYVRLKSVARERERERAQSSVVRPPDMKRQVEKEVPDAKLRAGAKASAVIHDEESDAEDDDPWLRDPHLAGLMEREKRPALLLKGTGAGRASVRAGAGLDVQRGQQSSSSRTDGKARDTKAPAERDESVADRDALGQATLVEKRQNEDDSDDDLDAPVRFNAAAPTANSEASRSSHVRDVTHKQHDNVVRTFAKAIPLKTNRSRIPDDEKKQPQQVENTRAAKTIKLTSPNFDQDFSRPRESIEVAEIVARRAAKKKRRPSLVPEIPTFLF